MVVRAARVSDMRIVFCGTPEFAVPSLLRLTAEPGFSVEAVITQPDRPRGRGHQVSSSPVKEAALRAGLRVYQPETIKSDQPARLPAAALPRRRSYPLGHRQRGNIYRPHDDGDRCRA
jgi:hypothetical protein